ncbi:complement C4-B-like [Ambystoma mexicanum]|uniref:complement C4-B-like n=1 Tax=Ambystoma mexicanum TaxID=8296 RepID=UPI0037E77085
MDLLLWLACIGALVNLAQPDPSVLITAPNIIHVDVPESVAIQVEGATGDTKFEVYFENQLQSKSCSPKETFTLNQGNNFIEVKKLKVSAQQVKLCGIETLKRQKYIQLVAEGPLFPKARKVPILLSTKKGYLFIQTDKPIYTPAQQVQVRVFPLDHVMRPLEESVTITFYNPQGIQVKKAEWRPQMAVINEHLTIPDISDPGVWTITAMYSSAPDSNSSAQFEVKKYVLPNFEIKILPAKPFFLLSEEAFNFIVEASYVYGESVMGVAYVRFAILDEAGEKKFLRKTEQQITLVEGKANVKLTKKSISDVLLQPLLELKGTRLYIAVMVLETATGALEEQELSTVKFVISPYAVDLSKTERYFVPGTSHKVVATVSYTDGSLAAKIPVKISVKINGGPASSPKAERSDDNGVFMTFTNTPPSARTMEILATVGDGENSETSRLTVNAYQSSSQSYLYIMSPSGMPVRLGESVSFQLKAVTSSPATGRHLYYMVLNKGQILLYRRASKETLTNIQFPVTGSMVPSFRLVAYYYAGAEIVSNSVWVDVEDLCEGKLHVEVNARNYHSPGANFQLTIETDDQAQVALAAVDSAVYLLNQKNKLSPKKAFQAMNEYDLGCSVGSGKDFKGVFEDAGLSFISSRGAYSALRPGYGCRAQTQRKKRALDFQTSISDKLGKFKDPQLKQCCRSGMTLLPPHMKRSCADRSAKAPAGKCREALLECCTFAQEQRKKYRRVTAGLGRVHQAEEDEDYEDEDNINTRSLFPESWLWKTVNVNKKHIERNFLPHSITTWEIQAISVSKERGFCIAEPVKVKVFQPFHIYLTLPYSVKRFEQMEIRPTLYNYLDHALQVRVTLDKIDGLCSPATAEGAEKTMVLVPNNSAVTVPFSIVPMTKLNIPITVTARGRDDKGDYADRITKILKIARDGVARLEEKTYNLDTNEIEGTKMEILGEEPSNMIPDGEVTISVRVSADISMETVNNSLGADSVSRFIRVPLGCAEQTMIYMAPGVYAMKYLDETEQWTRLGPERRDEALETMKQGQLRILTFRKQDGSYGAWVTTPSSTWLTAFVAKILSLCREHITVEDNTITTAVNFILKHQVESTGAFTDPAPVYHREMQGGVGGLEGEVSLTAFVTIALHHTMGVHTGQSKSNVRKSIEKAARYLKEKLPSLTRPYTVAITAYALTLVSDQEGAKMEAHSYLMDFATKSKDGKMLYWESKDADRLQSEKKKERVPSAAAITVEGTAFALMHMLLRDDILTANKIATWLTGQQNYGGGFKSTQDTVVALEALSRYWTKSFSTQGANLALTISSPGRSDTKRIHLDKSTTQVQETLQYSLGNDVHVDVKGKGKGTLTILKLFNVMQVENTTCQELKLDMEVTEEVQEAVPFDDYEDDYDYDEDPKDEPVARIHWQDLRRRRKREAGPAQADLKEVVYKVWLWRHERSKLSGMAIVDITMLSGFEPDLGDLDKLKDLVDRYISHYEYQHGRLQLYFETVPLVKDLISFRAKQNVKVGALQPASATLYDFYEPDTRCHIFYNLPSRSRLVSALCTEEVCQCAEGPCPKMKKTLDIEKESVDPRQSHACYNPRVKYGYRTKLVESAEKNGFVVYKVQIVKVLQRSNDEKIKAGDFRNFIQRKACQMQLNPGKEYLLMGKDGDTTDTEGQLQYLLESTSWIEELGSPGICKATTNRNKCALAEAFMEEYGKNGCMV